MGDSEPAQQVRDRIEQFGPGNEPVLITGESGTGKEVTARAVHRLSGRQQFIGVNCAALPADLLESELFGHEKGAFTGASARKIGIFEQADKGTVFLDEIGEMARDLQAKLLRLVEGYPFRRVGGTSDIQSTARVIAATHRDLEQMVADGTFREDLRYRLDVLGIELPPLRARMGDIPALVGDYLARKKITGGADEQTIATIAAVLTQYDWPGNVRQLHNILAKVLAASGGTLSPEAAGREISRIQARKTRGGVPQALQDDLWGDSGLGGHVERLSGLLHHPLTRVEELAYRLGLAHGSSLGSTLLELLFLGQLQGGAARRSSDAVAGQLGLAPEQLRARYTALFDTGEVAGAAVSLLPEHLRVTLASAAASRAADDPPAATAMVAETVSAGSTSTVDLPAAAVVSPVGDDEGELDGSRVIELVNEMPAESPDAFRDWFDLLRQHTIRRVLARGWQAAGTAEAAVALAVKVLGIPSIHDLWGDCQYYGAGLELLFDREQASAVLAASDPMSRLAQLVLDRYAEGVSVDEQLRQLQEEAFGIAVARSRGHLGKTAEMLCSTPFATDVLASITRPELSVYHGPLDEDVVSMAESCLKLKDAGGVQEVIRRLVDRQWAQVVVQFAEMPDDCHGRAKQDALAGAASRRLGFVTIADFMTGVVARKLDRQGRRWARQLARSQTPLNRAVRQVDEHEPFRGYPLSVRRGYLDYAISRVKAGTVTHSRVKRPLP